MEVYARYSLAECLKSGNTTVFELGMIPAIGEEKTLRVIGDSGIRACEGHVFGDGAFERVDKYDFKTRWLGEEVGAERLGKAVAFAEKHSGALGGRLITALSPSSVLSSSISLQRKIKAEADRLDVPVSIHAGEWVLEFQNMLRMYGKTPIGVLAESGLLSPRLTIGHCWAVSGHPLLAYPSTGAGDLGLIATAGATVSHDPVVFAKRGNRMHSHSAYLRAGVSVSIGTDTAPQDILNEMRIASYVSKLADWDYASGTSREIFDSVTLRGARALGRKDLGHLAPGALADIAVIDMTTLNTVPCRDPIRNLVNSVQRGDVKYVMVDGEMLVEESHLVKVDERKLAAEVQRVTEEVWRKIPEHHPTKKGADEVSPPSIRGWEP
jgi:5-methylthioadenosine/S-adenosylhomocysteine deaminase